MISPDLSFDMVGYRHTNYVQAFAALGTPQYLPTAQGWVLKCRIPGSPYCDAMGVYPFFDCQHWEGLSQDLLALQEELISLRLVTDPFGDFAEATLQQSFPALFRRYKEHFVVDLQRPWQQQLAAHHRRNLRQAQAQVEVEACNVSAAFEEWLSLYPHLIERHQITGLTAFSRASFAAQWQVPGLMIWRAKHQGETIGMTLWYCTQDRAYYHLAAYTPRGYELKASYALFYQALDSFAREGMRWGALGAGAGTHNDGNDGLTRFKRGWATETRPVYLCGRIFNPRVYAALTSATAVSASSFFPAYRQPVPYLIRSHAV